MRRIQGSGSGAARDPEEDRKKSREAVFANLVLFCSFVVAIRVAPIILNSM